MLLGGYLEGRLGPFKIPTWQAEVAKQVLAWQPHRHSNGQTLLTVQPGYFLNTLVTWSPDTGLLLVQGAQRFLVVTWGRLGPLPLILYHEL